jgi:diguanylate cyclase (GGDEF)-like protein/PAS domain S-box-containing protein
MNEHILNQRARAFDHLFDAVVVTDLHGIITDWNKGSEALYGYSRDEAIGQVVALLHVPEDSEQIIADVFAGVEKNGKWSGEIRMLHKNGTIGWIESMCVPIYDADNQMIGALGINRDISSRISERERLAHQAYYDQLTAIPNRYLLLDRLEHLIAQCERKNSTFSLLYIDLDKFKSINDSLGHGGGDKVLIEATTRLKQSIRSSDTVARIGGDEFVILLENTSTPEGISVIIETVRNAFKAPMMVKDQSLEISCSIGVSIYPADGTTVDALLSKADASMYRVKNNDAAD